MVWPQRREEWSQPFKSRLEEERVNFVAAMEKKKGAGGLGGGEMTEKSNKGWINEVQRWPVVTEQESESKQPWSFFICTTFTASLFLSVSLYITFVSLSFILSDTSSAPFSSMFVFPVLSVISASIFSFSQLCLALSAFFFPSHLHRFAVSSLFSSVTAWLGISARLQFKGWCNIFRTVLLLSQHLEDAILRSVHWR